MQFEGELQRRRRIMVLGIADDVLGERQLVEPVLCHCNMNDRRAGEYPIAKLGRELKRGECIGDDNANVALGVLVPEKIRFGDP